MRVNRGSHKKVADSKGVIIGKAEVKFDSILWYTMLVEVKGGNVAVQTDNGVKMAVGTPELDVEKTGYRFVTPGESLLLDDVKVWEVAR